MKERIVFVGAAKRRLSTFTSLCATFGISTKTGYKWLGQFECDGVDGLHEKSRRPKSNSRALAPDMRDRVLALRHKHSTWGPRKLVAWLEANEPHWELPAPSTVGLLLKRRGLVRIPREARRVREPRMSTPLSDAVEPNALWSMDFKGDFLLGGGERCHPLTITDNFSRYLLRLKALVEEYTDLVWRELVRTFSEYGLPLAMRVDNQQPWCAPKGDLGLTKLAAKLIRLGIRLERIATGKPQENGRHERFHLTLKQDTALPPAMTFAAQQRRFDDFRHVYNDDRPHESLGQKTPASAYTTSPRAFPARLPTAEYPAWFEIQRINAGGFLTWRGGRYFLSGALAHELVGLIEVDDGCWEVWFCTLPLGCIHVAHSNLGFIPTTKPLPMSSV
jgi:putative transposase